MSGQFDYFEAFSRNIGWLTAQEQAVLRGKRVAIAGLGGVGGSHLLTLTRLGIGAFNIADLDHFELANFNRQAGASLGTIGEPKVDVLARLARDINPDLDLRLFPTGIDDANLDAFLDGVDLYLDGLDFFAVAARRAVFAACTRRRIPAVTAAPLGMGTALLNFLPGKMTFEEYFRLEGQGEQEQLLRFLIGLSPAMLQAPYLVDDTRVDLRAHKGPSTPMACELCAGLAATHVLKILLRRGKVPAAPVGLHFDAYRNRLARTWRPGGNRNPLQRAALAVVRRRLRQAAGSSVAMPYPEGPRPVSAIERILDLARWAPSGDNTQPWRFEILDDRRFVVHAHDTRDWCVYDLEGRASQLAVGALLETIAIAASGEGLRAEFRRRVDAPETNPVIEVELVPDPHISPSPLIPLITCRTTQRRAMSAAPLTTEQKRALEESAGPEYRVVWIEGRRRKWQMARLLYKNAGIRLTIPEAFEVHRRIIEWDARFSTDRIPDQAVGLDPVAVKLMRWAMQSWNRVRFLNRYLAGTRIPRLQLDLLPGLRCAAHFVIVREKPLATIDDYLEGGRAVQRLWLTSTQQGLQFQPEMTPLIFAAYALGSKRFTVDDRAPRTASALARSLEGLIGEDAVRNGVFMGRTGWGQAPKSRSLRKPLDQ